MNKPIPTVSEIEKLIGENAFMAWSTALMVIKSHYIVEAVWNDGGKLWVYEYKFRCGGKTLCGMYLKKDSAGIMIVFGKNEREQFEKEREQFSLKVQKIYDEAKTFHDGKWVMFPLNYDTVTPVELSRLLFIKKKPNKKYPGGSKKATLCNIKDKSTNTADMLYTYSRKTDVENNRFKFSFEFDLDKEIVEADLADIIIYCCQRDLRMQEILLKYPINEQTQVEEILKIANIYRKNLIENRV